MKKSDITDKIMFMNKKCISSSLMNNNNNVKITQY